MFRVLAAVTLAASSFAFSPVSRSISRSSLKMASPFETAEGAQVTMH